MDRVKKEDFEEPGPLDNVQKSSVLHDAQIFSEPHIQVNECYLILTKIMYLLVKGESFTTDEATKLFFGVTKLFQSQDPLLRRMVYLLIKELGKNQDNVFIVINCLSKDMTGSMELFQGNAIRVLSKVIDSTMLASMERFIKQAIVDRNSFVSSSALIAGEHLFNHSPEVVKRWSNEVQEALSSSSVMVQYHALALLYLMKKHDRLAATKVVAGLSKRPLKGALANVLLIRFVAKTLLSGQQSPEVERTLVDFLSSSLHHKNSMVAYEASKVLCTLPCISPQQISPAISVLQEFLNSAVVAQRFAAVRLLNSIVGKFPQLVTPCSVDLELLITDQNRNIATLAITTLLKTGVEASIDRLMKSITGFMNDVSDDLRKIVVDSIRSLSLKFPHKYASFLEFLATILREEGGFAYKRNIVETIMKMMKDIPESKEMGLECFCDFIEDCEFPLLSVQILDFLGEEAPKTLNPAKYIRYIFNRVILEQPRVRSAAVSALAKFAISCDSLADNVLVLMKRCLVDNDDEVRDRAVFYSELFDNQGKSAVSEIQTGMFLFV